MVTVTATICETSLCRADISDSVARVPDYLFRCSYCIKLIAEDSPVYMRHDSWYCSTGCRDKGLSRLYTSLKESQLHDAMYCPSSGSLTTSGNWKSDSSLASRTTHRSGKDDEGRRQGPLARLGQRVLDAMLQRVASRAWGAQVLRTYSSGMLWGRELTKDTSARALFNYLPEVDRFLDSQGDGYCYLSDQSRSSTSLDLDAKVAH
mmetsp:Transcript_74386/g.206516  ORF Transcript_74386/g.206516 Transcript_74386/m.206516 type:complete len:206 (-) Transcript_74386:123-740(-)